jgi:hypothetical protein
MLRPEAALSIESGLTVNLGQWVAAEPAVPDTLLRSTGSIFGQLLRTERPELAILEPGYDEYHECLQAAALVLEYA